MQFYPIKTNDGSISLYNFEVNDVYHSRVGAYTEALHKYVIPSGILDFVRQHNEVKILDVCYGLGYNSRTAAEQIIKICPKTNVSITALELDPVVLSFSALIGNECYENELNQAFFTSLNNHLKVDEILNTYLNNISHYMPQIQKLIPSEYELLPPDELNAKLHNIYYQSLSFGKSIDKKTSYNNINVEFHIKDARQSLLELSPGYDFIFHDPFTPSKMPVLWTVEIFKSLYRLLNDNGNLTTYSNAAPIRSAMLDAGFSLGNTNPVGKKTTGTIAYKNPGLIKNLLSEKEIGLLKTKAGIPYRDENFNKTNSQILHDHENEKLLSNKISTSSFLKSFNKISC